MPRKITFTDETVRFGSSSGSTAEFKTKDGQATFTAQMKDGKVARITATGPNGKAAKVFYLREVAAEEGDGSGSGSGSGGPTGPIVCRVCIEVPGGAEWCYIVDCGNVPGPSKLL